MTRHFVSLNDIGQDGVLELLDRADFHKRTRDAGDAERPLVGKSVALIFEKASTRTRVSLEIAVAELGGNPIVITAAGSQIARGEPVADTARVMSRMCHAITLRTYGHDRLLDFVKHSSVPVLNALTDESHPMQLLADLQTVRQHKNTLQGLKYAWIGDGNNMANSWLEAAGLLGLELALGCPEGYDPDPGYVAAAKSAGANVQVYRDPMVAVHNADVISTDVFTSMGQEAEHTARLEAFAGFCVTQAMLNEAKRDAIVMHCLPAHRGEEVTADVIDGPQSVVWDQAEGRLHTSKAVLVWSLQA